MWLDRAHGHDHPVLDRGTSIGDRYRLAAIIGRGGAATVWRARDVRLDRDVAVKILTSRPKLDSRRRFVREARLAAAIRHPNVVDLLDLGDHHGRPFVVMELLEGEPLHARLDREVHLETTETVALGAGLLDGLAAAHRAGVVHRDLKPANVFLVNEGRVARPILIDFGVSRSLAPERRSVLTTSEGMLLGTPEYMSPEQARGALDLDHRADLYSAGVILYETLAGVLPYESETLVDLIVEIVTREPWPLTRIRPELEPISRVLARAMAHRPDRRFASAREMREALLAAHAELGGEAPSLPSRRPHARRSTPLSHRRSSRART